MRRVCLVMLLALVTAGLPVLNGYATASASPAGGSASEASAGYASCCALTAALAPVESTPRHASDCGMSCCAGDASSEGCDPSSGGCDACRCCVVAVPSVVAMFVPVHDVPVPPAAFAAWDASTWASHADGLDPPPPRAGSFL